MKMRTTLIECDSCGAHLEASEAKGKWYTVRIKRADLATTHDVCDTCVGSITGDWKNK